MKRFFLQPFFSVFISALVLLPWNESEAETLDYRLSLSLGHISIGAGTASLSDGRVSYDGDDCIRMQLTMNTGRAADVFFVLRDTIVSVQQTDGTPLHYEKIVNEADKHNVETADFSETEGRCDVNLKIFSSNRKVTDRTETWNGRVYDMLGMLRFARGLHSEGRAEGSVVRMPMVNGDRVVMQNIVYEGVETVKDASGNRRKCLRLSVRDSKYGTERETLKVYVTDDERHIPVRLDIVAGKITIRSTLKEYKD